MKHDVASQTRYFYANARKAVDAEDSRVLQAREAAGKQGERLLTWVKGMLVTENPWQLLDRHFQRLTSGDLCDEALLLLLNDTAATVAKKPDLVAELRRMAETITGAARVAIDSYRAVARANARTRAGERKRLDPDLRPAAIYRRFAKPLRWLRDQGHMQAAFVLKDILAEQTLPFSELDAPAWIDRYTLTVDPDADKPGELKVRVTEPVLDSGVATQMANDLGWDAETVRAFLTAQEGFNAEDGLETILAAVDEDALGRLDDRLPQWMEMQNDCHPSKEIALLRAEAKPYTAACRALINELVKQANEAADLSDPYWKNAFFQSIKAGFRESAEAADFLAFLNEKAEEGAVAADIAVLFLQIQHGYGFDETDAEAVRLHHVPNFRSLYEWLEFWGDELLESLNDAPWRWKEVSSDEIAEIADQTIADVLAMHDHATSDVFRTRAFMEGYLKCMINANVVNRVVDGKKRNLAVEAGWESFRRWKNPEGADAYHRARAGGKTQKEAMSAFWSCVRAHERRVASGTVVAPKANGILLNTGRLVDWRVALLKLQKGELYFPGDTRERIKNALLARGIGLEFASAL